VEEMRVGIVLKSFRDVVGGVKQMLDPAKLQEFRKNVAALENHAIFEIPEILAKLLGEPAITIGSEARDQHVPIANIPAQV
jgi:hypothetical protein